jgi:hypothetical protein
MRQAERPASSPLFQLLFGARFMGLVVNRLGGIPEKKCFDGLIDDGHMEFVSEILKRQWIGKVIIHRNLKIAVAQG